MNARLFERPEIQSSLRRQFWAELQLPVEWAETEQSPIDGVIVDPNQSSKELEHLRRIPRDILLLKYFDFLKFEDGVFWPRALALESLRQVILRRVPEGLDLRAWALVTGTAPLARAALGIIFHLGFRQARLIYDAPEEMNALQLKSDLEKYYFGLKISLQKTNELTLQPNNGSILINTVDLEANKEMLETLLYLNFLHRPGMIVDMPFHLQNGPLIEEGHESGFETVAGCEVQGEWDYQLLGGLGIQTGMTADVYQKKWAEFLAQHKPAPSVNP